LENAMHFLYLIIYSYTQIKLDAERHKAFRDVSVTLAVLA